jgi:hypothetical protein
MNEKRIKSLVEILKTTIRELEDEMQSDTCFFSTAGAAQPSIGTHNFDYSEILRYDDTIKPINYDGIL